jgi:hypothetical protein
MANHGEHKSAQAEEELTQELGVVAREYSGQSDYLGLVGSAADMRQATVDEALRAAFRHVIRLQELEVIDFRALSVTDLAAALVQYPVILKPLLAVCNVAGRAIERDLDLRNVNTYGLRLRSDHAHAIAGYIKGFLPDNLPLAALTQADRNAFIDKEIRAGKGRWEKLVNQALVRFSGLPFAKTKFRAGGDEYELDCAYREQGVVRFGVDVKRIEARRDIHKRADEIVNKATKLKQVAPSAKFGAVVYYPFTADHGNIRDRLQSPFVDSIQFAGETPQSVTQAVRLLLSKFGVATTEESV